ncbi:MAG: hypothetical protein OIN89_09445 [Candidatus Methanoperedens sp.]|nr:hypothetical protein [Candidatus Methanoperedens sp.]PKL52836.1 MAG: hypothetical protein CVV36_10350 [Candidatus Methanoperedenaceae archaeon HGW-Methanoperedenaceae-1]
MSKLIMDNGAIEFIKNALGKENAKAMRIFTSGGGCCKQFEMSPVEKPLAGDVSHHTGGITVYVEKEIADNTSSVEIKFDENRGLLIEFR